MGGRPRSAISTRCPQEVGRQQHGDGQASVREERLGFSPRFSSLHARWDPGMIVHADPAGSETLLAACGVEQLPNPPITGLDWLEDTRSRA